MDEEQKRDYIAERVGRYLGKYGKRIDDLPLSTRIAWGIFASLHPQEFFDTLESGKLDDVILVEDTDA